MAILLFLASARADEKESTLILRAAMLMQATTQAAMVLCGAQQDRLREFQDLKGVSAKRFGIEYFNWKASITKISSAIIQQGVTCEQATNVAATITKTLMGEGQEP